MTPAALLIWGGPVYCTTLDGIPWLTPTKVKCIPAAGSTANAQKYTEVGGLGRLIEQAGGDLAAVGLAGFSAFHGFAQMALKDTKWRERVDYVHLADACFMGEAAKEPYAAFLWFAQRAVKGETRLVATTNGPWGGTVHYEYAGKRFDLTSGATCVQLFWDIATAGLQVVEAPRIDGAPPPTKAMRCGEFYWYHYETGGHEWHANVLARPHIEALGVPWLASRGVSMVSAVEEAMAEYAEQVHESVEAAPNGLSPVTVATVIALTTGTALGIGWYGGKRGWWRW